jgi:hypothetical protein
MIFAISTGKVKMELFHSDRFDCFTDDLQSVSIADRRKVKVFPLWADSTSQNVRSLIFNSPGFCQRAV